MLIGLLIANSFFVRTFFGSNDLNIDAGFFNALQFVLPILMIFIELWTYDLVVDFFRYQNIDSLKESEATSSGSDSADDAEADPHQR